MNIKQTEIKVPFYVKHFFSIYLIAFIVSLITMYALYSYTSLEFYVEVLITFLITLITTGFIAFKINVFYKKYNQVAVDLIHNASPHEAIKLINQLLKYPPKSSPAYLVLTYNKALSIFYMGFPGDAITCLKSQKMPKLKIFRFVYFHNRSIYHFFLNEYELAQEHYLKAVSCSNKIKNNRGVILHELDDLLERLKRTLSIDKEVEEAYQFFYAKISTSKNLIERLNNHYFFAKASYTLEKILEAKESLEFILNSNTNTIYTSRAEELMEEIKKAI